MADHGIPDSPRFSHTALFGGRGQVDVWDLLRGRAAPPFAAVLRCRLAAGGHVGRHVQEHHPELIIGIDGDGEARVDGTHHALTGGAAVHLPLGSVLEIVNRSDSAPLDYFIIKAHA